MFTHLQLGFSWHVQFSAAHFEGHSIATQVVLRTDWFSGSGWLATHEVMQESYGAMEKETHR